jgi:hypothetical protein
MEENRKIDKLEKEFKQNPQAQISLDKQTFEQIKEDYRARESDKDFMQMSWGFGTLGSLLFTAMCINKYISTGKLPYDGMFFSAICYLSLFVAIKRTFFKKRVKSNG